MYENMLSKSIEREGQRACEQEQEDNEDMDDEDDGCGGRHRQDRQEDPPQREVNREHKYPSISSGRKRGGGEEGEMGDGRKREKGNS